MAVKGRPSSLEIFNSGSPVLDIVGANQSSIDFWIKSVARESKANLDWTLRAGQMHVKHLGDTASRVRVEQKITQMQNQLLGKIVKRYPAITSEKTAGADSTTVTAA